MGYINGNSLRKGSMIDYVTFKISVLILIGSNHLDASRRVGLFYHVSLKLNCHDYIEWSQLKCPLHEDDDDVRLQPNIPVPFNSCGQQESPSVQATELITSG